MRKGGLEIQIKEEGDLAVVYMNGDVDLHSAETMKTVVGPLCVRPGARILLDCTELSYVNSSCLGRFNDFHQKCMSNGGRFALCAVDDSIYNIMELLGLTDILTICEDQQAGRLAIAAPE